MADAVWSDVRQPIAVLALVVLAAAAGFWLGGLDRDAGPAPSVEPPDDTAGDAGSPPAEAVACLPGGWCEFHPTWRTGNLTFEGVALDVPANASWASDGEVFLYVRHVSENDLPVADCDAPAPGDTGQVFALIDVTSCHWVTHPAIGCTGFLEVCEQVVGPKSYPH